MGVIQKQIFSTSIMKNFLKKSLFIILLFVCGTSFSSASALVDCKGNGYSLALGDRCTFDDPQGNDWYAYFSKTNSYELDKNSCKKYDFSSRRYISLKNYHVEKIGGHCVPKITSCNLINGFKTDKGKTTVEKGKTVLGIKNSGENDKVKKIFTCKENGKLEITDWGENYTQTYQEKLESNGEVSKEISCVDGYEIDVEERFII